MIVNNKQQSYCVRVIIFILWRLIYCVVSWRRVIARWPRCLQIAVNIVRWVYCSIARRLVARSIIINIIIIIIIITVAAAKAPMAVIFACYRCYTAGSESDDLLSTACRADILGTLAHVAFPCHGITTGFLRTNYGYRELREKMENLVT